jgi:predicted ATPase/class 3 adenylate cyclase/DNA-binding CsgD family transcriptional regulator
MQEMPRGTITLLFTAIERSTALWEAQGEAMSGALERHKALLTQAIASFDGYIFKTADDGLCAAFVTASAALGAALRAQRALYAETATGGVALRMRVALHSGAPTPLDHDYIGAPLNRAARLLAAGHGGQTLLTLATAELLRDDLPPGVELRDLGVHRLKDLSRPERIFQLVDPELPQAFPPLRSLDRRPNNLPVQFNALIGRERELARVCARLLEPEVRLVTLIGPGGAGKTRLALQVAAELLDAFEDGVFFVALEAIRDPDLVAGTMLRALGLKETGQQSPLAILRSHLRDRSLLLVLDNCEQVIAAAPLVAALLEAAPGLKLLATSRAVLGVYGEYDLMVPPLALPDMSQPISLETLSHYEAARLFIERAQAAQADFMVSNETAPAVAEICHRLDGLPLAIELAAARVRLLPPLMLLKRLSSRLKLLVGGAQTLPARQQTLRKTIDWSYQLLDDGEQALFARLAVFVGSHSLSAVEAICNGRGDLPLEALDGLQSLIDKSLLRQAPAAAGEARFLMLETIREYALERLEERGELEELRGRHAACMLELIEQAEPGLRGREQMHWLNRIELELDNLRAALGYAASSAGIELGLRLAVPLRRFWLIRGHLREGRTWLEQLLAQGVDVSPAMRARGLSAVGGLALAQGDYGQAQQLLQEAVTILRGCDDQRGVAVALLTLATCTFYTGDPRRAVALEEESLSLFQALDDPWGVATALHNLGFFARWQGQYERASAVLLAAIARWEQIGDRAHHARSLDVLGEVVRCQGDDGRAQSLHEESLALRRSLNDKGGIPYALKNLAELAYGRAAFDQALAWGEESLAIFQAQGDSWGGALALHLLGRVALELGDATRALSLCEQSLAMFRAQGDRFGVAAAQCTLGRLALKRGALDEALRLFEQSGAEYADLAHLDGRAACLEGTAATAFAQGAVARAVQLLAAAAALREAAGAPLAPLPQREQAQLLAAARTTLGEGAWDAAWREGWATPLDAPMQTVQTAACDGPGAAEAPREPPAQQQKPVYPAGLTAREVEVLALVAQGMTDTQVAKALVVSPRTVNAHLSSIYSKLGVTSRTAAARFAFEHQLA